MTDRMSTMGEKDLFEIDRSVIYSKEKGYGYLELTKGITKCDGEYLPVSETDSVIALKNGGWNVRRLAEVACRDEIGSMLYRNVDLYRIDVPEEGTYRVDLSIDAGKEDLKNLSVFAGRRNLIDYEVSIKAGEKYTRTFYQAVTPYIPPLCSEPVIDRCIFISIAGMRSHVLNDQESMLSDNCKISVNVVREDVPVIWVAGDSTLTDQSAGVPYYPYGSCAGWAQTLARFIDKAAVCNLAHSGMTTNCFRDDGHFAIVKKMIKPGDLFIMQFGHNDQKRRNLGAFKEYDENLRRYVREIRRLGAEPVICSPISRIPAVITKADQKETYNDEKQYYSLLSSYAKAAKKVSDELDVSFADLHKITFEKWAENIEDAHDFFMPGDITHTNEYGALLISGYFVEEMRKYIGAGSKVFEKYDNNIKRLKVLPDLDTKVLPKELPGPDIFRIKPPYVDIKGIPEYESIKKAFRYGLLDPCVMHLHPYATLPRAQLLMLLFRAFGKAGVRPYKGSFKDIFFDEWDSGYVQALEDFNMIDLKCTCKKMPNENTDSTKTCDQDSYSYYFRPDDMLTYSEFAGFIIKFAQLDKIVSENLLKKINAEEFNRLFQENGVKDDIDEAEALSLLGKLGAVRNKSMLLNAQEPYGVAKENEVTRQEVYSVLANIMEIRGQASKNLPSDSEVHPVH